MQVYRNTRTQECRNLRGVSSFRVGEDLEFFGEFLLIFEELWCLMGLVEGLDNDYPPPSKTLARRVDEG
jgi:hypothetical protein